MQTQPTRRAFSLVEVIFAFAMLSGMLGVLMHFFLGSQRQSVGSEQKLNSALVAQMVIERLRSQASINPAWFKQLGMTAGTTTSSGTVVDPAAATPAAGTQLSPFFEYLFLREGTNLYSPANRVAMPAPPAGAPPDPKTDPVGARRRALVESFRDYRVDVRIEDDVPLESGAAAAVLREMVKKITVTVSRGSVIAKQGSDPGAVTLTSRMVTPPESLSEAAITQLNRNFDNSSVLIAAQETFFQGAADATYLSEDYLGKRRTLIADCYMMLQTVNTERFLTEKKMVASDVMLIADEPGLSLNEWLDKIKNDPVLYRHAAFKKQVAKLYRLKAKAKFDAFKRLLPLLDDLHKGHQEMLPEIAEMTAILLETQEKIVDLNKDTLDSMKAYQDNVKRTKEMDAALTALDPKQEEADRLKADAEKLKAEYDLLVAKVEELSSSSSSSATTGTTSTASSTSELDAAKEARDKKKVDWNKKKEEFAAKQAYVDEKRAALGAAKAEATATMNAALAAINAKMAAFAALTTASGKDLMDRLQLVVVCKFMNDFFQNATYQPVVDRIRTYPGEFREALDRSRATLRELFVPDSEATPLELSMALQDLVEVEKTRMLERGVMDPSILTDLDKLVEDQGPKLREAARFTRSSELRDWTALSARNRTFLDRLALFKNLGLLGSPANTYENIVSLYAPSGKIRVFLDTYTQVTREIQLNSDSMLVQLNRDIQGLRGDLALIGNATQEEILRAIAR